MQAADLTIEIGGKQIGDGRPPYLIAEIGQNHNGDEYAATRLIGMAVKAGCDAVKFQLRCPDREITRAVLDAPHPEPERAYGSTYREHRTALDLTAQQLGHLQARIQYNAWPIAMIVTPCDASVVGTLEEMDVPAYKIASRDLTNLPLLERVGQTGKPVILSTGLANDTEISDALQTLQRYTDQIVVLQCTSVYPCPNDQLNLLAIRHVRHEYGVLSGLSDHSVGILAPPLAVALGACVIEKHITLARAQRGSDHAASLEEDGLRRVVRDCHAVAGMLGDGVKRHTQAMLPARRKLGRSLVAAADLSRGDMIQLHDLAYKSPGDGLPWSMCSALIGRRLKSDLAADSLLQLTDVE